MSGHVSLYVTNPCSKFSRWLPSSSISLPAAAVSVSRSHCLSLHGCRTSVLTTIMASSMSLLGLGRLSVINAASKLALNPIR